MDIPDKSIIKRTLDMVGLQDTGKKSVRNFSLGMRQRLGIAIAAFKHARVVDFR